MPGSVPRVRQAGGVVGVNVAGQRQLGLAQGADDLVGDPLALGVSVGALVVPVGGPLGQAVEVAPDDDAGGVGVGFECALLAVQPPGGVRPRQPAQVGARPRPDQPLAGGVDGRTGGTAPHVRSAHHDDEGGASESTGIACPQMAPAGGEVGAEPGGAEPGSGRGRVGAAGIGCLVGDAVATAGPEFVGDAAIDVRPDVAHARGEPVVQGRTSSVVRHKR